ncbi:MAG: hypothetical protein ABIU95_02900 [Burkholderiales bacterium]
MEQRGFDRIDRENGIRIADYRRFFSGWIQGQGQKCRDSFRSSSAGLQDGRDDLEFPAAVRAMFQVVRENPPE